MIFNRLIHLVARHPIEFLFFGCLLTAITILALRVIVAWWKVRRLRNRGDEVHCAVCGYILVRGSSTVCPECGSDVRDRGVITASSPPPAIELGPAYLIIALLSLPLAAWIVESLKHWHPVGWRYGASITVSLTNPDTGMAGRWCVQADGDGRYFGRRTRSLMIYRNDGGDEQGVTLVIRPKDLVVVSYATGQSYENLDRPLDRAILEKFVRQTTGESAYASRRVSLDDATAARVSQEMLAAAQQLGAGRLPAATPPDLTQWVSYSLADWVQVTSTLCVAAVMFVAAGLAMRRVARALRSRKRRRWHEEVAAAGLVAPQQSAPSR